MLGRDCRPTPTAIAAPAIGGLTAAGFAGWPDWSPNGDLIVFETYGISVFETGGPGATNLYVVGPDGSGN